MSLSQNCMLQHLSVEGNTVHKSKYTVFTQNKSVRHHTRDWYNNAIESYILLGNLHAVKSLKKTLY